ncbi:MAG: hypothetical protein MH252_04070 [Thermosynechococcaceae cyanobacterium MS004]|nr:hypothetical protein [Thermosynechococcaceae cyanobacterium MS004]
MKTQWQIYQELELIPDSVPQPKAPLFARVLRPLRRSFSNAFVRELADRHRIFLFNRCLDMKRVAVKNIILAERAPAQEPQDSKIIVRFGKSRRIASEMPSSKKAKRI